MEQLYNTAQASTIIGTSSRYSLLVYLSRHPHLKPAAQLPAGAYQFTKAEIDAIIAAKAKDKPGRPKKGGRT